MTSPGLHHITAIAGSAARNHSFYTQILGLRLVKSTVNFDDPGTRHLYYADAEGTPGSIITFFPWAGAAAGRVGTGETVETAFRIPEAALSFWIDRLSSLGVATSTPVRRFGRTVLPFADPDGMALALVADRAAEARTGASPGIAPGAGLAGFAEVTLRLPRIEPTADILTDVFGWSQTAREGDRVRFEAPAGGAGASLDLVADPHAGRGRLGRGSVHHVAFRAASDEERDAMADALARRHGLTVTPVKDREYFRSVYAREPGGVLFEIATDEPGFAIDEEPAAMGSALKLPAHLESRRDAIEATLPPLA